MKNIKVDFKLLFIIISCMYLNHECVKYNKYKNTNLEDKWINIKLDFDK